MKRHGLLAGATAATLALALWLLPPAQQPAAQPASDATLADGPGNVTHSPLPEARDDAGPAPRPAGPPTPLPGVATPASPTAPSFSVSITATLKGSGRPKPPAPGKTLEIGVAANTRELGQTLATVVTDAQGLARAELPWSALAALGDVRRPQVWVRSSGPGMIKRWVIVTAPDSPGEELEISLETQPGLVVQGTLLGPDGEPVAGWIHDNTLGEQGWTQRFVSRAEADGFFRGELHHEGAHMLFGRGTADADTRNRITNAQYELGSGVSEPFEVAFDTPLPPIIVRLSGPGRLEGLVVDDDGRPAAGLQLSAEVVGANGSPDVYTTTHDIGAYQEREGRGHRQVNTVTDDRGAFVVRGLRSDLYQLWATIDGGSRSPRQLLTEYPVSSMGPPLTLRLTRPHLAIHVRRADGSLPDETLQPLRVSRRSALDEWLEHPGLLVTVAPEDVAAAGWSGPHLSARATSPGEFVVELHDTLQGHDKLTVDLRLLGTVTAGDREAVCERLGVRSLDKPEDSGVIVFREHGPGKPRASHLTVEDIEDDAADIWLLLEREGRWPEPLQFARRGRLSPMLRFGARATTELLTPGSYTLVARSPGGRAVRRAVQLVAGQTLSLTLILD